MWLKFLTTKYIKKKKTTTTTTTKNQKTFARYKVNLDFLKILYVLLLTAFYPSAMLHMQKFFKKRIRADGKNVKAESD